MQDFIVPPQLQAFLSYLTFEKRYSAHTVRAYQDDLMQFFQYLLLEDPNERDDDLKGLGLGQITLQEITPNLIRSWLAALKKKEMVAKSINRKISSLSSFFKYNLRLGNIKVSPTTNITALKQKRRLPVYIKEEDMKGVLKNADKKKEDENTKKQRAEKADPWKIITTELLIQIFYNTGMRLSELIQLKENQINFAGASVKVLGKGNKERVIPILPQLSNTIKEYIKAKRSSLEAFDDTYLLVDSKGKKLYPKYAYRVVNERLKDVPTLDKRSPHILRHSFATHLMNHGADLNAVKELLGHSSLAATQVYTHNSIEKLKDAYKKAHPKA